MSNVPRVGIAAVALLLTCASCLAQTSETVTADGESVTILRDSYGVPHVFADSLRGLFFGNGYAVAEDRLAQMEFYRRDARGEMAEIVGSKALAADKETRINGYSDEERMDVFHALTPDEQTILQSYADGVNAWREKAIADGKLPKRLTDIGVTPGPWRVSDSIAVGQMMAQRFGGEFRQGQQITNLQLVTLLKTRYGRKAWTLMNDLMWRNDPKAPTTIPDSDPASRHRGPIVTHHRLNAINFDLLFPDLAKADLPTLERAAEVASARDKQRLASEFGLATRLGSYAVAVSGKRSLTGNAMLIGGPQMGLGESPQIAHEIALHGAGIDSIGLGFAGSPGVLIGHNAHVAWSFTSGLADVADAWVEKLNPADSHQYWFKGAWRTMDHRVETIEVKDGSPVKLDVYRTVHGPVVQFRDAKHQAFSMQTSCWKREMRMFTALIGVNRALRVADVIRWTKLLPVSFNILCADQAGSIGYRYCGDVPIRDPRVSPLLPSPGTGEYEWRGFYQKDEMPHVINPKQGFLVNWNTKPATWWSNGEIPFWGAIWRSSHEADVLTSEPRCTTNDLRNLLINEIGVWDPEAETLLPMLRAAAQRSPSKLTLLSRQALLRMSGWDFRAQDGSVPKRLFDMWIQEAREDLFLKVFGTLNPLNTTDMSMFNLAMQPSLILHVLERTGSSVPVLYDYLKGRTPDEVMLTALNEATARLNKELGPVIATWRYTRGLELLGDVTGIPDYERGSYIQIIECGKDRVTGVNALPPGQNENPGSPHFSDQRDLAGWWFFKPMLAERADIGKPH